MDGKFKIERRLLVLPPLLLQKLLIVINRKEETFMFLYALKNSIFINIEFAIEKLSNYTFKQNHADESNPTTTNK